MTTKLTSHNLANVLEHTLLAKDINETQLLSHLDEALSLNVFGVCIPLAWVPLAKKRLSHTKIKIITVIDFPLGQKTSQEKAVEAIAAAQFGADEIDMVMDYQALINRNYHKAFSDINAVVKAAKNLPIKVIVETSALNHDQLVAAISLVALSEAKFIKTSTGFHQAGAKVEHIALMHKLLPSSIAIKASGGIKNFAQAKALIEAGAQRIGASQSRTILTND